MVNKWALIIIICLIIQSLVTLSESSILSCNKLKLNYKVAQHQMLAHIVKFMYSHISALILGSIISLHLIIQICSEATSRLYIDMGMTPGIFSYLQTLLMIVITDLTPIILSQLYADALAYNVGIFSLIPFLIIFPMYTIFMFLLKRILRLFGKDSILAHNVNHGNISRHEIPAIFFPTVPSSHKDDMSIFLMTLNTRLQIYESPVKAFMVPITRYAIQSDFSKHKIINMFSALHLNSLPVIKNGNPIGTLNIEKMITMPSSRSIVTLIDNSWHINGNTKMSVILESFSKGAKEFAIITENKRPIGIITLNEILKLLNSIASHEVNYAATTEP